MVDGILVVRFALIGPLICHIRLELVELFDAQMKVLLEGEERTPPTGDIVRCMEDRVGVGGSSSMGRTDGRASARHCELHRSFDGDSNLYRVEKLQV